MLLIRVINLKQVRVCFREKEYYQLELTSARIVLKLMRMGLFANQIQFIEFAKTADKGFLKDSNLKVNVNLAMSISAIDTGNAKMPKILYNSLY